MEQRRTARRRTYLGGQLRVGSQAFWSADCSVRDLGEGGARIALRHLDLIPDTFSLEIPKGMLPGKRSARLVWYRDGMAGVSFEGDVTGDAAILASRIAAVVRNAESTRGRHLSLVR